MNSPLPGTGTIQHALTLTRDAPSPFAWLRGFAHIGGQPHAPDPEKTSWQLPGAGIITHHNVG